MIEAGFEDALIELFNIRPGACRIDVDPTSCIKSSDDSRVLPIKTFGVCREIIFHLSFDVYASRLANRLLY